jgi:CheY-like chemotaxis protein
MPTIVISGNSGVLTELTARRFQRLDVTFEVVTSGAQAIDAATRLKPALVILETQLPDSEGYDICRRLKDQPSTASIPVMLVVGRVLAREQLSRLEASGCNDVFCLPGRVDDLYLHVASVLGMAGRASQRSPMSRLVTVEAGGQTADATVHDLSRDGAKIGMNTPLGSFGEILVHLARTPSEPKVPVNARIVWQRPGTERGYVMGLQFVGPSREARKLIAGLMLWEGYWLKDVFVVRLRSDIAEDSDFTELSERLAALPQPAPRVEFDMSVIRRINSFGMRSWVNFVSGLPAGLSYSFVRASAVFTVQASMIRNTLGRGAIISLFAPYRCDGCGAEQSRLLETSAVLAAETPAPPGFACTACGGRLEFDDVPEHFFAFLQSQ